MDIRPVHRTELHEAIQLVNEVFREPGERTMEVAFARSFSSALGQSIGAFEDGKLVSFMGLVPTNIRIGPSTVPVYQLGQVCTHPDWQGRGYANGMMEAVIRHIKEAGASLLFVSGARSLYARHQCLRFGGIKKIVLGKAEAERLHKPDNGQVALREREITDLFRLHELDRRADTGFERSLWDLADLIASEAHASCKGQRHQVYVADQYEELLAYIVVRVPREGDEGSKIALVEWAGDAVWVTALLAHAMRKQLANECEMSLAWEESGLLKQLEDAGCQLESHKMPGTIRVLDSNRLHGQLRPYYHAQGVGITLTPVRTLEDGSLTFEIGNDQMTLTAQQWTDWLFSPKGSELDVVLSEIEGRYGRVPVPLPYPGGLNYV